MEGNAEQAGAKKVYDPVTLEAVLSGLPSGREVKVIFMRDGRPDWKVLATAKYAQMLVNKFLGTETKIMFEDFGTETSDATLPEEIENKRSDVTLVLRRISTQEIVERVNVRHDGELHAAVVKLKRRRATGEFGPEADYDIEVWDRSVPIPSSLTQGR